MTRCAECDEEIELDEPQQCYFTGRGPCGDCRNPRDNQPLNCFHPVLCDRCERAAERAWRRQRRLQALSDNIATAEYRNKKREERRSQYLGGY